jgi:hypothetical protein
MPFDRELVEAQLALRRIATADMPKLAWAALEAGIDGPATRRLAALQSPTFFEVREVLPKAMQEWQLTNLSPQQAAVRLVNRRAREILQSNDDPLNHSYYFRQIWMEVDYCGELAEYGELSDDVHISLEAGEPTDQVRARFLEKLKALAHS